VGCDRATHDTLGVTNDHFHSWIVANLPAPCGSVLDVGCGQGEMLAGLAPHVGRVVGSDTDAIMRDQSAQRCAGLRNVAVVGGRRSEVPRPFDVVTMIAILHHLEVEQALRDVHRLLATGGRFLVVGLARPQSFRDQLWDAASAVKNPFIGYVKHPWPSRAPTWPPPFPVRDPELSFDQLRDVLGHVMPGSTIRHPVGFRHTIAWTKPH
jgi:ubiquinone/menaquinone biosynthesis C-methylase UbiE